MANHVAAKVGGWAFRDPILSTQITALQEALLKCPNFSEGSEHSPTGDIKINGTGGGILDLNISGRLGNSGTQLWSLQSCLSPYPGVGRIKLATQTYSLSGNLTLGVTGTDSAQLIVITGCGGSDRNVNLSRTGVEAGDWKMLINLDATRTVTFRDETSGGVAVGFGHLAIAVADSTRWYCGGVVG